MGVPLSPRPHSRYACREPGGIPGAMRRHVHIAFSCPPSRTGHTLSRMELLPSAHVDTFCRDHLPPADEWPELAFDLPELQYPDHLNCATRLLDDVIDRNGGTRPCLHQPGVPTWSYD